MSRIVLFGVVVGMLCWGAAATEIEGRLRGAPVSSGDVTVTLKCRKPGDTFEESATVGADGVFRFTGVTDDATCDLDIRFQDKAFKPYTFHTKHGKLTIERELKVFGNKLVAL